MLLSSFPRAESIIEEITGRIGNILYYWRDPFPKGRRKVKGLFIIGYF